MPAFVLGIVSPLPRPTQIVAANSTSGCDRPITNTPAPAQSPNSARLRPARIIGVRPRREDNRAVIAEPIMKPPVIDPRPTPIHVVDSPNVASATKGAPVRKM
jgi:hypothetical protein